MNASKKRQQELLRLLSDNESLTNAELAETIGVSLPTIRRDLGVLEEQGLIRRSWGGASLIRRTDLSSRIDLEKKSSSNAVLEIDKRRDSHIDAKRMIAKKAMELISENDTIILDSGSTTLQLADSLKFVENLSVVTNSLPVINILADSRVNLQSCGGYLDRKNMCFIGPETERCIDSIHVSKAFISTSGMHIPTGFSIHSPFQGTIKRKMIECADQVCLLMDSSKINRTALTIFAGFSDIDIIVTEKAFSDEDSAFLSSQGIRVLLAQAE